MSADEFIVLIASGVFVVLAAPRWLLSPVTMTIAHPRARMLGAGLSAALIFALIALFVVLSGASAPSVRNSGFWIGFYLILGAAWTLAFSRGMRAFGLSAQDDVFERGNAAAAALLICATLAHAAIFIGANIGDGPGWWSIIIAAALAEAILLSCWGAIEFTCAAAERISVERDLAAGLRLGGFLLGAGAMLARGAAGDWTSFSATVLEFAPAWPILPLTLVVITTEKALTAAGLARQASLACVIGLAYFAAGASVALNAPGLPTNPAYHNAIPAQAQP